MIKKDYEALLVVAVGTVTFIVLMLFINHLAGEAPKLPVDFPK